jgi:hypothetical protein
MVTIRLIPGEESDSVEPASGERIVTTPNLSSTVLGSSSSSSLSEITLEVGLHSSSTTDASTFAFDPLSLAFIVPYLTTDGNARVVIKIPKDADASSVHTAILLSGLTAESERTENAVSTRVVTSLYKPTQKSTVEKIRIAKGPAVKINIDLDDDLMDGGDINEDDLLNDTTNMGLNAPPAVDISKRAKDDDCGGRKPCDDCTCGRADVLRAQEQSENAKPGEREIVKDIKSNCGSCAKGDAFRCAGCPFLGKPAFKEGEEHLVLDLADDL